MPRRLLFFACLLAGAACASSPVSVQTSERRLAGEQTDLTLVRTGTVSPILPSCVSSTFFAHYRTSDEHTLILRIDLRDGDYPAPDCVGQDLEVELKLGPGANRCRLVGARVKSRTTDDCGREDVPEGDWQRAFTAVGTPDIASAELARIELRDAPLRRALLLLPDGYFFYEGAGAQAGLKPELATYGAEGCCYGSTGLETLQWSSDEEAP